MISVFRNFNIQNTLNKRNCSHFWEHLRCISKASVVTDSYCLKKNEASFKSLESGDNMKTIRQLQIKEYSTSTSTAKSKEESQKFFSYFPGIVQELKGIAEKYAAFGVGEHFERVLEYNLQGGKKLRGVSSWQAYQLLVPKDSITEDSLKLAGYLGWCIEMLHAAILMIDDIMDRSITRRGRLCWYKVEDIQLSAINDAFLVDAGIYQILKDHFSHMDCYIKILELFHEISFTTTLGQYLDAKSQQQDVLSFTMEQYKNIAIHKTSYYGYYLPIASALHLAGYTSPEIFQQAKEILLEIGLFFQIQDDFIDCFGDPKLTGKIGTDIQDGKCTWLSVTCVQRATDAQKEIMKECYGKDDTEAIARIKQLYEELSLPDIYATYEKESYNRIKTQIQKISQKVSGDIFLFFMNKLYNRKA
ncbi:farnesyl pyrophosphate synthase-like [Phlebotomus papatasi]|uniref:farnesyl pyrophosphate synthase-like n=1 Tax=Phlebotomus papatasi TaxID=29031 RepID=UPI002483CA0B|nr:farnesyl pyrophosphate synthase-like [Phlebotomus papatasi]